MQAVLDVVLPVFGIVLAGFLVGRSGLLGAGSSEALNRFVFYCALPALFFISMSRLDASSADAMGPFLIAWGGGLAAVFTLAVGFAALFFRQRPGALGLHGLSAIFSNTGYMGIPLVIMALGEDGALPAIVATVANGALVMGVGTMILEADLSRGTHPLRIARNVVTGVIKSPLLLSAAAGLVVAILDLPVPAALERFCDLLAAAVAPCALFAMGLFMVGRSVTRGAVETSWITVIKLGVHPLVTWWLAFRVLDVDPLWANAALILAALPTGALVFVLAQQYEIYVQRSTAAILISTIVSVLTLSLLFAYMGYG
ncbi:MAG: AEC family transporter [Rhodovibrionaceae bacterium]|nr:AEC family transporter [Rhodovibrionaceae bacterium]